MQWLVSRGASLYTPLVHSPNADLIADFDGELVRIQVKTSTQWQDNRYVVSICTRGGNRSWNGIVKRLDESRCDRLFVHVGDGRRWYIPATALGGDTAICLGGPKYSEFEIEPGQPLPRRPGAGPDVSSRQGQR
jgi:hypothetical protein